MKNKSPQNLVFFNFSNNIRPESQELLFEKILCEIELLLKIAESRKEFWMEGIMFELDYWVCNEK